MKHQMIVSRVQYPAQSVPAINKCLRLEATKNKNLYLRQSTPLESEANKFVELLTATPMPAVLQSRNHVTKRKDNEKHLGNSI